MLYEVITYPRGMQSGHVEQSRRRNPRRIHASPATLPLTHNIPHIEIIAAQRDGGIILTKPLQSACRSSVLRFESGERIDAGALPMGQEQPELIAQVILAFQRVIRSQTAAGIRITSYNVCYTKLLRGALKNVTDRWVVTGTVRPLIQEQDDR